MIRRFEPKWELISQSSSLLWLWVILVEKRRRETNSRNFIKVNGRLTTIKAVSVENSREERGNKARKRKVKTWYPNQCKCLRLFLSWCVPFLFNQHVSLVIGRSVLAYICLVSCN